MGAWLVKYGKFVFAFGLLAGIAIATPFIIGKSAPPPDIKITTPNPTASPTPVPTATPAPLRVYITGAVKTPGVYILPPNSIINDVLAAAGGATQEADLDRINLAQEIADQQQIYVPRQGEEVVPVAPVESSASDPVRGGKININTASVEELDTLNGIGPAIAQRIIDYRTENGRFVSIQDIMNVKGIGSATFAKFEQEITVE